MAKQSATNRAHHQQLIEHTRDRASYNGHGFVTGRQGARGHDMTPSNLHLQGDAHIPQGVLKDLPSNKQNTASFEGSADADAAATGDYSSVDCSDK
jgi:hypothetical protein